MVHAGNVINIQLRQHGGLISFNELDLGKGEDDVTASSGYQLPSFVPRWSDLLPSFFCLFPSMEA